MKKTYVAGPVYWVIEYEAEGKVLGWGWMAEVQPPFRFGQGLRVRFGKRAYQAGVCRKSPRALLHDVEVSPEDIGKW